MIGKTTYIVHRYTYHRMIETDIYLYNMDILIMVCGCYVYTTPINVRAGYNHFNYL